MSTDISAKRSEAIKLRDCCCSQFAASVITTEEIIQILDGGATVVLVDVRCDEERNISMLPSAISKSKFESEIKKECEYESLIIVYCTIGYRSGSYASQLMSEGFTNVRNYEGIVLWTYSGRSLKNPSDNSDTLKLHTFGKEWDLAAAGYTTIQFSYLSYFLQGIYVILEKFTII
mmetsp:Transcript_33315/g.33924  ORF Transcript_33315/g.33924 Transcript_33315/m.33924 type:complete len:175 (-) Transcript_33315:342-866(-)